MKSKGCQDTIISNAHASFFGNCVIFLGVNEENVLWENCSERLVHTTHNALLNHWVFLWVEYAEIVRWLPVGFEVRHYNIYKSFQKIDVHISLLNHLYANFYMPIYQLYYNALKR